MTADWYPFTPEFLRTVSARICNQVRVANTQLRGWRSQGVWGWRDDAGAVSGVDWCGGQSWLLCAFGQVSCRIVQV